MEFSAPFIAYKESHKQWDDQVMSLELSGINSEQICENFSFFLLNGKTGVWGDLERLLNFEDVMDCGGTLTWHPAEPWPGQWDKLTEARKRQKKAAKPCGSCVIDMWVLRAWQGL